MHHKTRNIKQVKKSMASLGLECLEPFNPIFVGTIPIGIDTSESDVDIICEVDNPDAFINVLNQFEDLDGFRLTVNKTITCNFVYHGMPFEIYGENQPTKFQNGYRHMMIEKRLLDLYGETFKESVITLKTLGLKTEPTFALLLGLFGNPYESLLTLVDYSDEMLKDIKWHNPLEDLAIYKEIYAITYVDKGWSSDFKLKLVSNEKKYLLRITPLDTFEKSRHTFDNMNRIKSESIITPKCIELIKGNHTLALFTWIEGSDLTECIQTLSKRKQYELGLSAGQGLNDLQFEGESFDFETKFLNKIDRVIGNYINCFVTVEYDKKVIDFIQRKKHLLKDRPITWQHGDYHIGNMLVTPSGMLGILDFNRSNYGDPWEEYDRFVFTWDKSPEFAYGQLKGYFGTIPENFFDIMALYNALNALAAIPWAISFGEEDINNMIKNYKLILNTYNNFNNSQPKWYNDIIQGGLYEV